MPSTSSRIGRRAFAAAMLSAAVFGAQAGDGPWTYEVTVTNVTAHQQFTPLLLATHRPQIGLFTLGSPALPELATLAEQGDVAPLRALLDGSRSVRATATGSGLLGPGQSMSVRIVGHPRHDRLSLAAMLIPTNDAFVALNAVPLPWPGRGPSVHVARAYDAGSEVNDETCASIPGPFFAECGGPGGGAAPGGGEGFVHVHRGMHGVGDFRPADRDWRNPVAEVRVRLVR